MKNKVTIEDVKRNMQNVLCRTVVEFGKPCTYVTVQMENGFTIRESTTCVDPANYDEAIGKKICLEKIEDKIWNLLGYALQEKLYQESLNNEEEDWFHVFVSKAGDGIGIIVGDKGYEVNDKGEINLVTDFANLTMVEKFYYHNETPITHAGQMKMGHTYVAVSSAYEGEDVAPMSYVIKPSLNGMFGTELVIFDGESEKEIVYTQPTSWVETAVDEGYTIYELTLTNDKK